MKGYLPAVHVLSLQVQDTDSNPFVMHNTAAYRTKNFTKDLPYIVNSHPQP